VCATTAVAALFFIFHAEFTRFVGLRELNQGVRLPLYFLGVIAGMAISGRYINRVGPRLHRLTWSDSAQLASRQVVLVALVIFMLMAATKDALISRVFVASYLVLCGSILLLVNRLVPGRLARIAFHRVHQMPTLLMGRTNALKKLESWVEQKESLGIQLVGFLSDERNATPGLGGQYLGKMSALERVIEEYKIGQVIVLGWPADAQQSREIIEICQSAGCRILFHDDIQDRMPLPLIPIVEGGHFFFTLQEEPLEDPLNRVLKRILDIAVALPVVIFILPPLCVWVWFMQRRQAPGPLLYVRSRGGRKGAEFQMLKFRSMYCVPHDETVQARKWDDRIFPFGHFLRRTSLDEFPQFYDVLMGHMSVVGPRPHLSQHDGEFRRIARTYRSRQLVKPGITGLAQTRGYRGEITDPELLKRRVEFDIYYITHWSIWMDLNIIARTALQIVLPPRSAY
jgi:exopolysaccharide biosynthesis polyprenyl glycosylphosphotransferase